MVDDDDLRNDVIDLATNEVHQVFIKLNKMLQENKRRPVTVDETDICLERIRHFTQEARIVDICQRLIDRIDREPSPQMKEEPKTNAYH